MKIDDIKQVCVVGAGAMGRQIALNNAIYGYDTVLTDSFPAVLESAAQWKQEYLDGRVAKGRLTREQVDAAAAKLRMVPTLEQAASGADLVIEAVVEKLDVKRQVFAELDRIAPEDAILATNSSTIVSSKIADATKRSHKVANFHYFNPALVMQLVEVVQGPHTSDETVTLTMELARKMGKTPVLLQKEVYGFLVNRILAALMDEAVWLADMKVATPEDIDTAVTKALGHPMGPFRLMDLTGIDLHYDIAMEQYRETGDPKHKPSPLIVEKVVKGEHGRKTGKGWYEYKE